MLPYPPLKLRPELCNLTPCGSLVCLGAEMCLVSQWARNRFCSKLEHGEGDKVKKERPQLKNIDDELFDKGARTGTISEAASEETMSQAMF